LGLALTAVCTAGAAAQAQERPIGQIDAARGVVRPSDALVTRSDGGPVPARSLVRLYEGDRITVTGSGTQLTLFLAGAEAPTIVSRANSPYVVRGRRAAPVQGFVSDMLASLDLLFNRPRMAIATVTEARGLGNGRQATAFLPVGAQRLPPGTRRLLVLWSGPSSVVQVVQGAGNREWTASLYASTFVEAPPEGDFQVVLPGDPLGWTVTRVPADETPRAQGTSQLGELTADERLANAIWLLADGGTEWRLFAISEVADLAQTEYSAARLLAAIRSGEIEPEELFGDVAE